MLITLFVSSALFHSLAMGQQRSRAARSITPKGAAFDYEERKGAAAQEVRAEIARLHQQVAAQGLSFQVGYTAAMDFPLERITGLIPPADFATLRQERALERTGASVRLLGPGLGACSPTATSFDWRRQQAVTPVRDQGPCGSCWAFATHGSFEGTSRLTNRIQPNLDTSEQDTLDCSGAGSCNGGWWAFDYLLNTGSSSEARYSYLAQDGTCKPSPARVFHAQDWDYVNSSSVSDLKQALCEHGPLAVAVNATAAFQAYTGGVFNEFNNNGVNHGVTLIGWNDAQQAWIIKNSWGTGWGETGGYGTAQGYMRIAYGSNNIGSYAAWSDASTAVEIETDTSWRAISPGNETGSDIRQVGLAWEASHTGWNTEGFDFDDSDAAGWKQAIFNATQHPVRPDFGFIWSEDPAGDGMRGASPTYFRKMFQLTGVPQLARLTVMADDDAIVYINGRHALNDADRTARPLYVDVTSLLRAGWNHIAVKAHDSFGAYEGLYISLRLGAHVRVNPAVNLKVDVGSKKRTSNIAGCPANAGYVAKDVWTSTLTNLQTAPLSDVFIELANLTGDHLFLTKTGEYKGASDIVPVAREGLYADGELAKRESVKIPFAVCLRNKKAYQLTTNVLAVK
jgi:cathepsin L